MSVRRIVVLGASGFVGTTLVEHLGDDPAMEVVPVIHSAGSAWRLARRNTQLLQVDVADRSSLTDVLQGAAAVVNCTRGSRAVMIDGLANILESCRTAHVGRFVHLSSVMVYGDPPHPASTSEDAPTTSDRDPEGYAGIKVEQDELVQAAAGRGLPSVVLCPPNISGPFSGYLVGLIDALRGASFALMDEGAGPVNLVDVRNLCHAIRLALDATGEELDGRRMFVTDGEPLTWADLVGELAPLAEVTRVRRIGRDALVRLAGGGGVKRPTSLAASLRHLVSSDVRAALRKDPLWEKVDRTARGTVARMGKGVENRLRLGIEGPPAVERPDPYAGLTAGLCAQQLRDVRHMTSRIGQLLGYRPLVGFRESMADFRRWYAMMRGFGSPSWPAYRHLYPDLPVADGGEAHATVIADHDGGPASAHPESRSSAE